MPAIPEPEISCSRLKCPKCTTPGRNRKTEPALLLESMAHRVILLLARASAETSSQIEFQDGETGAVPGSRRDRRGNSRQVRRSRRAEETMRKRSPWPLREASRSSLLRRHISFFRSSRWFGKRSRAVPGDCNLPDFPLLPKRNSLRHWHEHFFCAFEIAFPHGHHRAVPIK